MKSVLSDIGRRIQTSKPSAMVLSVMKQRTRDSKKIRFNDEFDYNYHMQLYKRYREHNDTDAFNELVSQYTRLAHCIADSFQCKYLQDDLRQEAIIALMESIQRWNPERGRLTTIALRIIKQRLGRFLKRTMQGDNRENNRFIYNDESKKHESRFGVDEVEDIVNKRFQIELAENLVKYLHDTDQKILYVYIYYSDSRNVLSKVAECVGLSKPEVRYRIKKINAFLKTPTYCAYCNKPYLKENFSKFCSNRCRIEYDIISTKIASCNVCGKLFVPNKHMRTTCSIQCKTRILLQNTN